MNAAWNSVPVRFAREVVWVYLDLHISRSAAALAYFLILTFFPILICINAFIGMLHLDPNVVLEAASTFIPQVSLGILGDYLNYINIHQSTALLIAGTTMTLFSASAAMRAIMNIMDDIYGHGSVKSFWRLALSVAFSLLLLITVYLSMIVVLSGNWFFHLLETAVGLKNPMEEWHWMRFVLLFFLVLLFILLIYHMSVPRGTPHPPILIGGIITSAALVASSMLFSWFMGISTRYSLVYGSLASVIILLVWLYVCGNILILGNVFSFVWYRQKQDRNPELKNNP